MNNDLTSQKLVTYYFPGGHSISVANPVNVEITTKDDKQYHVVNALDGSSLIIATHWLAMQLVPRMEKEIVH